MTPRLIAVMGPTASGKTTLAERLADHLGALLLNADAFQVYRGLDIGTAKPIEKQRYRLLDLIEPSEPFGVGEWVQLALAELRACWDRGQSAVLVGGTGLYIRALLEQYDEMLGPPDPKLRHELNDRLEREGLSSLVEELRHLDETTYKKVDRQNPARVIRAIERAKSPKIRVEVELPPFVSSKVAIDVPTHRLDDRIANRVVQMVQNGWSLEIERLRKEGFRLSDPGLRAIGYRPMWRVAEGEIGIEEAVAITTTETRKYAKRQRTWLRSEPDLTWLSDGSENVLWQQITNLINC